MGGVFMLKKILVPVDGSDTAFDALKFAMVIGEKFDSELVVVNVEVPYDYTKLPKRQPKNQLEAEEMERAPKEPSVLDKAKSITDAAGYEKVMILKTVGIDPAERISEVVTQREIDMVVMGNRGMGAVAGFFIGSVSAKVYQEVNCPVIIVK
jgi:nucleotide-binding universal stress UspA family protein